MEISLNVSKIIEDIRQKSHLEVTALIENVEARYNVEAGTEKLPQVKKGIEYADGMLRTLLGRFLVIDLDDYADNSETLPTSLVYELEMTTRRAQGKVNPLTKSMHAYVVDLALARYYESVGQAQLSSNHMSSANATADVITKLLYSKIAPTI